MRLVIIGAGFAGMYAALSSARLRDIKGVSPEELEISLVSPEPTLVVRPRLYEPKPETLTAPLLDVLEGHRCRLCAGRCRKDRHQGPGSGRGHLRRCAKEADLRSAGRGQRQPPVPSEYSRASPSTRSVSTTLTMRSPSTVTCTVCPSARRQQRATRSSLPAAASPALRRQRRCRHGCAASSGRMPSRASSSSNGTLRSHPTWAQVRGRSSRTPCASSVWRPGSASVWPRSTNPASR